MALIPKFNELNTLMEKGSILQAHRNHLGYSMIGGHCMRQTWYSFRWVKDIYITPRIQRLFERGLLEEARVVKDLVDKGCMITDAQLAVVGITGHAQGHLDGVVMGVPTAEKTLHLLEIKTMKSSKFNEYLKVGLKRFSSAYWQQIHSYMGHAKLTRCLYVVTNKDTEERDYKRIHLDQGQFDEGERLAFHIITAGTPPYRIPSASNTYFKCKFCNYKDICLNDEKVKKSCRTCKYWDIEDKGEYSCSLKNERLKGVGIQINMMFCRKTGYKLDPIYES